jgi:hypothetical protein
VKIVPDDLQFNFNLGAVYFATGDMAKAKEVFLKLTPRATDPVMKAKIDQFLKDIANKRSAGL